MANDNPVGVGGSTCQIFFAPVGVATAIHGEDTLAVQKRDSPTVLVFRPRVAVWSFKFLVAPSLHLRGETTNPEAILHHHNDQGGTGGWFNGSDREKHLRFGVSGDYVCHGFEIAFDISGWSDWRTDD